MGHMLLLIYNSHNNNSSFAGPESRDEQGLCYDCSGKRFIESVVKGRICVLARELAPSYPRTVLLTNTTS